MQIIHTVAYPRLRRKSASKIAGVKSLNLSNAKDISYLRAYYRDKRAFLIKTVGQISQAIDACRKKERKKTFKCISAIKIKRVVRICNLCHVQYCICVSILGLLIQGGVGGCVAKTCIFLKDVVLKVKHYPNAVFHFLPYFAFSDVKIQ